MAAKTLAPIFFLVCVLLPLGAAASVDMEKQFLGTSKDDNALISDTNRCSTIDGLRTRVLRFRLTTCRVSPTRCGRVTATNVNHDGPNVEICKNGSGKFFSLAAKVVQC